MSYFTSDKIQRFHDKILISNIIFANVDDYDCFICAGFNFQNNLNNDNNDNDNNDKSFIESIKNTFNIRDYFILDKNPDVKNYIPENTTFYNLDIDSIRSKTTANLSYFCNNYENIFLKMNVNGKEFDWLFSLKIESLLKFKQIIMYFYENNNNNIVNQKICFDKLNYTHNIVYIFHDENENENVDNNNNNNNNNGTFVRVIYLRKDIDIGYDNYSSDLVGITIDNVVFM